MKSHIHWISYIVCISIIMSSFKNCDKQIEMISQFMTKHLEASKSWYQTQSENIRDSPQMQAYSGYSQSHIQQKYSINPYSPTCYSVIEDPTKQMADGIRRMGSYSGGYGNPDQFKMGIRRSGSYVPF